MDQIAISTNLANAIAIHLRHGGSRLESDMLADRLQDEANAPAREQQTRAQWQAMLDAKVAEVQETADARVAEAETRATPVESIPATSAKVRRPKAPQA